MAGRGGVPVPKRAAVGYPHVDTWGEFLGSPPVPAGCEYSAPFGRVPTYGPALRGMRGREYEAAIHIARLSVVAVLQARERHPANAGW